LRKRGRAGEGERGRLRGPWFLAVLDVTADVDVAWQQHAAGAKDPTAARPLAAELDAIGGDESTFGHAVETVAVLPE
jgi:hypothetical protein